MFLNSVIKERRKQKGLNQSELAQGICTQATMSNIENKGTVPSLSTLINICKRLDLTLNDVVSDFRTPENTDADSLTKIERLIAIGNIDEATKKLNKFSNKLSQDSELQSTQYQFLTGYLCLMHDDLDGAIFHFNFVSDGPQKGASTYALTANICLGQIYFLKKQMDRASLYFNSMFDNLLQFEVNTELDLFWLKTCIDYAYRYFDANNDKQKKKRLIKHITNNQDYQISSKFVNNFAQYAAE